MIHTEQPNIPILQAMTTDIWLTKHPYLERMARLHSQVAAVLTQRPSPGRDIPCWDDYAADFFEGVPLLSSNAAIDLEPIDGIVRSLLEKLISCALPREVAEECQLLRARMGDEAERPFNVMSYLLGDYNIRASRSGLLYYLGWSAVAKYLQPVTAAFGNWREEERWFRNYCPTCGGAPAMGQLAGTDPGRRRYLSCGRCLTRWSYRRTSCPFCITPDDHHLAVVGVEGEALRIDYCESCRGYLKTYVGEGNETLFLADWTSIHLDLLARDRGLKRLAWSLYDL
jgi:FdhE protein